MIAFLRFVFIIFLVYFLFRFIGRHILPVVFKFIMKKLLGLSEKQAGSIFQQKTTMRKEGEVIIEPKKDQPRQTDKPGDYTDYEEVR